MWEKCEQYIKKIGTVVLAATVIIWFLSYFPRPAEGTMVTDSNAYAGSYIGMVGKAIEPVVEPLGLNWRSSIALIASIPAKELVVSTLGVLYNTSDENLSQSLIASGDFTKSSAAAFLVFMLLFFPCIATVATIAEETGRKKFAIFAILYNTSSAWLIAFIINQIGSHL
jgi:ferrous iron transport protein B